MQNVRLFICAAFAAVVLAGCPLPYDFGGKGGGTHTTDPSTPRMTAPVTVSWSSQGGGSGSIANDGSVVTGSTTTVTLSTTTENATIYYTTDGSAVKNFDTARKIGSSSGHLTITRTTASQSLDVHAVAIGPDMLPSMAMHISVSVSPYPVLSLSCDKTSVTKNGGTATFTITSSDAPSSPVTVRLLTGGTYTGANVSGLPA
ncbi:MAG TPA: chitobiase/beta-hexosaminidase C-terminal domain-containing protein, partial [Spirochaetia bacterium]|nr:chitobiase/beta-hexosaminidase C-terminal domain-containing protein [Spirochaetia bacterium]